MGFKAAYRMKIIYLCKVQIYINRKLFMMLVLVMRR